MGCKISYVVAIYNTQKYLSRCLDSLVKQKNIEDLEILLVDDGSTDTSPDICREYTDKCSQFKYCRKDNGGLSDARNYGVSIAKGEYVVFVDSDDWCDDRQSEILSMIVQNNTIDICAFSYWNVFTLDDMRKLFDLKGIPKEETRTYQENEIVNIIRILENSNSFNMVWNKMYRRDFLIENSISFEKNGMPGEDLLFNTQCFQAAETVLAINMPLYHYVFQDEITLSRKYRENLYNKVMSFCQARKKMYEFYDMNTEVDLNNLARNYINYCFACIPNCYRVGAPNSYQYKKEVYNALSSDKQLMEYITVLRKDSFSNRLFYFVLHEKSFLLCNIIYGGLYYFRNHFKHLYSSCRKKHYIIQYNFKKV